MAQQGRRLRLHAHHLHVLNITYTPYQTSNFTLAAGTHTVEFLGMTPPSADSTAFIDNAAINAGCAISDGSFEEPALAAKAYQVAPSGTSWQFAGMAGVSANASGFTVGNPMPPTATRWPSSRTPAA